MFKSLSRTLILLGVVFTSVMGLTYGTFIYTSDSTKATQMIIGDLTYGIDISSSNGVVSGKTVKVNADTSSIVNLKVTSLNEIDTKYGVDYKILSGTGTVKYASNTGWLPTGKLSKTNYGTYEKLVKIVINATSDMSVDFTISGGYSENELTETKEGYTRLTEKSDNITSYNDTLTNVTEKETNNYIYGGESVNNYLQYPVNDDNTKNIWRIIGYYNGIGTKIISSQTSDTTKSTLQTDLTSFYNTLENQDRFIIDTDKFNCTTSSCTSSSYSKIGLISVNEYNELGGINSYLSSTDNFFALDDNTIKSITPTGIEDSETSGLKPTIYLQDYVTVTGTGTVGDPFKLKLPEYTVTVNVVNGSATLPSKKITMGEDATYTLTPNTGYDNVILSDTCGGTYSGNTYTISGVTESKNCTITFKPKTYIVLYALNGGDGMSDTSKDVVFDSTYGTLPTPTRTGYTFLGWRGINLVRPMTSSYYTAYNYQQTTSAFKTDGDYDNYKNGEYVRFSASSTSRVDTAFRIETTSFISVTPNKTYTYSCYVRSSNSGDTISFPVSTSGWESGIIYGNSSTSLPKALSFTNDGKWHRISFNFTVPSTENKVRFKLGTDASNLFGSNAYVDIGGCQLEEGSSLNGYQPYYITSSTTVKTAGNHKITADWKGNEYTLTFNPNGGSVSTTSKTVTFGSAYGELPTPTRTGYTFKGWHNQLYTSSFNIAATTGAWNYKIVLSNLNPGERLNIYMKSASVTSGSATQFSTSVYDHTLIKSASDTINNNFGTNFSYSMNIYPTASPTSTLNLLIYSGVGGQTANVATSYNLDIYSTNIISGTYYTSSSIVASPYNHQLLAAWELNKYDVTLNVSNGSGSTTKSVSHGSSVSFTVTPSSGYKAELETNSCGGTLSGSTYTVSNVTSAKTCNISFKKDNPKFYDKLLADKSTRPSGIRGGGFDTLFTDVNSKTLYTSTENGTTVYYFAGNAQDNWVKFGGFYWRIIRTNADGSIRLLYHADSPTSTEAYVENSVQYNTSKNADKYFAYASSNFTDATDSNVKTHVDSWYESVKNNTAENGGTIDNYISTTAIYCNDTTLYSEQNLRRRYAAYNRLFNYNATYDCSGTNALTGLKAGLMTGDEAVFIGDTGGSSRKKVEAWHYYNSSGTASTNTTRWWTMTPIYYSYKGTSADGAYVYAIYGINTSYTDGYGYLYDYTTTYSLAIRPVISLKSSVTWVSGDGSASSPYQVGLN